MTTVFRRDEFVRSVVGPSVPGAQVFVCTQPANTAAYPPTPLASIYSDPAGLVPIQQPMITDGFGHCYFYVAVGTYTIVVANNSIIQQVYPDQLIGQTGAGSISLQSNSVPNTDQAVLNLKNGSYITVTPDGVGGVVLDTTGPLGTTVAIQVDGTDTSDQTVINIESTDGSATISNPSGGNIDIVVPPSGPASNLPFSTPPIALSQSSAEAGVAGAEVVSLLSLFIPYTVKAGHIVWYSGTGDNGSDLSDIGIYSVNGTTATLVAHIGATTGISSSSLNTAAFLEGTVEFTPGYYLFAMCSNNGAGFTIDFGASATYGTTYSVSSGTASGGVLPSTITLTSGVYQYLPGATPPYGYTIYFPAIALIP